jgi:hypothetical protein
VPRVRNSDIDDQQWDDPTELEIEEDDPVDKHGRRISPKKHPKEDKNWEENRKRQWQKRHTSWE